MSQPYSGQERRTDARVDEVKPVVLTRKFADAIDGIDLVGHDVGDRLPLNRGEADLLIAEGWARPVPEHQRRHTSDSMTLLSEAHQIRQRRPRY